MNKEKNVKKAFLWNMIGSTCYSGSSFLYLLVVTRVCGAQLAGFYSLSYATAQLLLQVGRYGVRTYQATDLEHKYIFSEYKVSRIITCALMMLFGIIYSSFSFKGEYIIISTFIIMMKMIDAVEDVFHGNLQQKYHVEQMGKMLAARNLYSAVFFTAMLIITKNLYCTCVATSTTSLILCLIINSQMTRKYVGHEEDGRKLQMSHVWELLRTCTPMFIGTFLSLLLYNIPKYAMAGVMTDEYQTYYSILFMPSFVISLMCEFVFKPTITTIAELWWENNVKKFTLYILRIIGIILVCCVAVVAGGHLIGRTLLEIIYGHEEDGRKLQMSHVWELLRTCTPMFIGTFLSLLLYNIPKYAMAGVMTDEYQTYYSILFMPSFVISLMCEFVFKPTITTIAELWWENNVKKFTLYILRIIGIILVCCVAVVAGGHLIGRTLLEIIYGVDLSPYKLHFVVLLIGGGISAEVYMIYNILIAIRWGKCLLPVYSITAVITIAAARILVQQLGIMGAALNYVLSCSILFVLFTLILIYVILRKKHQN